MHARSTVRRAVAPAAALLLPLGMAIGVASPASAENSGENAVSNAPAAAGHWLLDQAVAEDGQAWEAEGMPSQSQSLDSIIGLMGAGYGSEQTAETLNWLDSADVLDDYLQAEGGGLDAGALGKTLLTVSAAGGDINDFGDVDLEGSLLAIQDEDDGVFDPALVTSDAWAILGLNAAESDFDDAAYDALAATQCDDGSFAFDGGNDDGCFGDPDTTGAVIAALATGADDNSDAFDAAVEAGEWLLSLQGDDGGIGMEGEENANATAMASQAMLALSMLDVDNPEEYTDGMANGVDYLQDLQVDCSDEDAVGAVRFQAEEEEDWMEGARTKATSDSLLIMGGQTLATLDGNATEAIAPDFTCGNDANAESAADEDDNSNTWMLWALFAAGAVIVLIAVGAIVKSRKNSETSTESDE